MASVPSGGAGGAAPAAGGASGGAAAAEEKEEEKKEEGTFPGITEDDQVANANYREGRVRRGYGFRSLRLSAQYFSRYIRRSRSRYLDHWTWLLEEVVRAWPRICIS